MFEALINILRGFPGAIRPSLILFSLIFGWLGWNTLLGSRPSPALEFPPTKKGAPMRTAGGGVRDPKESLIPLLPDSEIHSFAGPTATLVVNVPQGLSQNALILILDGNDTVFEQEFQLPASPGLIGITIPVSVVESMQEERLYDWEFAVFPNGTTQREEQIVRGQLQRIEVATAPADIAPLDRAEFYAQQGIWQETLLEIAPTYPIYIREWQALLKSTQLESLDEVAWVGFVNLDS